MLQFKIFFYLSFMDDPNSRVVPQKNSDSREKECDGSFATSHEIEVEFLLVETPSLLG